LRPQEFVKLQLKRANELNDPERIINREVQLKKLYLERFEHLFHLDAYPVSLTTTALLSTPSTPHSHVAP
jgi:hypothetical protein